MADTLPGIKVYGAEKWEEMDFETAQTHYLIKVFCKNCRKKLWIRAVKGFVVSNFLCPLCECATLVQEEFQ